MDKPCKICKCIPTVLIGGRCPSCAAAKEAADKGISYGQLQSQKFMAEQEYLAKQQELYEKYRNAKKGIQVCKNCGCEVPKDNPFGDFCTEGCRDEWEIRERDAIARGAVAGAQEAKKQRFCVYCGKPLAGKRRYYCDDLCKYLHNQDIMKNRSKERAESARADDKKRSNLVCTICGEPIELPNMRLYCSKECATIGHRQKVKQYKENKKAEKAKEKAISEFEQGA